MFTRRQFNRNPIRNPKKLSTESLETRQLMAADAFQVDLAPPQPESVHPIPEERSGVLENDLTTTQTLDAIIECTHDNSPTRLGGPVRLPFSRVSVNVNQPELLDAVISNVGRRNSVLGDPGQPTEPDRVVGNSRDNGNRSHVTETSTLIGDADANGTVAFDDFLIVSSRFGEVVDAGFAAGDFNFDGAIDFEDFLTVSGNYGDSVYTCECDESDPKDGTKIQGPGELDIRDGSIVFISDNTVAGDKRELRKDAPKGTPIHDGMRSWQDIIDKIKDMPDGSITGDFVISGHGAEGGVDATGTDIDGEDITEEQAAILKKKLGSNARVVVLGCCQANGSTNDHMQRLANLTGASVVGNQGGVNDGANGKDDWFRFDPQK